MSKLPKFYDERLLVGVETSDDAAVYKVTDEIALIQTVDFFTPIVDDPYMFGQIAAANSLSDVYAMGGNPILALNVVGFPNCLDPSILGEILAGGADKVKEAGALLAGGHSVQDDEPKYGLCVSGFVHPDKVFKNFGCKPGDALILTKPIGNGIVNTAIKADIASKEAIADAVNSMASLNKKAKEVVEKYEINACTDITGFGLLGHMAEMSVASEVTFDVYMNQVPLHVDALEYAKMGMVPAGAYKNREHAKKHVEENGIEECYMDLLYDPQTSGGLLVSIPKKDLEAIMSDFEAKNMDTTVAVIGQVREKDEKCIYVYSEEREK